MDYHRQNIQENVDCKMKWFRVYIKIDQKRPKNLKDYFYVPSFKNLAQYLDLFAHCLSLDVITPPPLIFNFFLFRTQDIQSSAILVHSAFTGNKEI